MTAADLLRRAHLTRDVRDALVGRLAGQGLVRADGKALAATSYAEFVATLYTRQELPQPPDLRDALAKREQAIA